MVKNITNSHITYTYDGISYRQSEAAEAPRLVSFVVPAEELLEWASIPRRGKLEEGQIGFQRTEEEARVLKAKTFFSKYPTNQSPTAIVVGIHPVIEDAQKVATLELEDAPDSSAPCRCKLTISLPVEIQSSGVGDNIINLVKSKIIYRVEKDDQEVSNNELLHETLIYEDDSTSDDDEAEDQENIEVGQSILKNFLENLENRDWCESNFEAIRDFAKPATIIDGQHRLLGAAACERNIPFTVCAVYDCPWSEQVFQFTVINYTHKDMPDQFITANAALSLTGSEIDTLKERFSQAGVKVLEYDLMEVVQFDENSPFYNLVNLTDKKGSTNKIEYKTMLRIAKKWYEAKHKLLAQVILPNLYKNVEGINNQVLRQRLELWKSQDWGTFFIDFWDVIKAKYGSHSSHEEGHILWDVGHSNLMHGAVLFELQELFFDTFSVLKAKNFAFEREIEIRKELKERIEDFTNDIPAEFFATTWTQTSLDTGAGRNILKTTLGKLKNKEKW
jgi:hypothetical protein